MTFLSHKKIFGILAMVAFISIAVLGFLAIVPSHHHEPGCPFMIGEQSICPIRLFEHISAWQDIFTVSLPSIFSFFIVLIINTYVWQFSNGPNFLLFANQKLEQTSSHNFLYQELFSAGILNPKVF